MLVLVLNFFTFLSAVSSGSPYKVLDPRGRLGGKVGSACEEFEDTNGRWHIGLMFLRVLVTPAHPGRPR